MSRGTVAVLDYLRILFGPKIRLPRDQSTKIPRKVRREAETQAHIEALAKAIDAIAALPGLAEISDKKRVPTGFYSRVHELWKHYDAYADTIRQAMGWQDLPRAGKDDGIYGCYTAPIGVSPAESIAISRVLPNLPDLATLAPKFQERAQQQIEDIQGHCKEKDREKPGPVAVLKGRQSYERRALPCPFLDETKRSCKIWDHRPISCRMHHLQGDPQQIKGDHPQYEAAKVVNIRLPVKQQIALSTHVDKRLGEVNPLLFAGVLQALHIGGGQPLREVGQAPLRVGRDGQVVKTANKNVKGAKKFQKQKRKKGRRK